MQMVLYGIGIALGACVGSFISAAADRFGLGESVFRGRSKCRGCGKVLRWYELVPIVSFLIQRGRCRSCGGKIGWEAIAVEAAFAVLFLIAVFSMSSRAQSRDLPGILVELTILWFAITVLGALFLIDLKYGVVPDAVTLPAIAAFGVLGLASPISRMGLISMLLSGSIGAGFFFFQWAASRGRWVGAGDIRLGALSGVVLGWKGLVAALFLAYVAGALVSLFLLATKRVTMKSKVPFVPFIAGATILVLVLSR